MPCRIRFDFRGLGATVQARLAMLIQPVAGRPQSGAAVANMWALEILEPFAAVSPQPAVPERDERLIGPFEQHTTYIARNYGPTARNWLSGPTEERQACFEAWLDYFRFCGCNVAEVLALGVDYAISSEDTGSVIYATALWAEQRRGQTDLARELVPGLRGREMWTYASMAPLNLSNELKLRFGLTQDDLLVDRDGQRPTIFGLTIPNLLSPCVQDLYVKAVDDLARAFAGFPEVRGIGIGFDGFCSLRPNTSFDPATLARFSQETGIQVPQPDDSRASYAWLSANAPRWKAWLDWRCTKLRDLLVRLRDTVRTYRADWILKVRVMTSRTFLMQSLSREEALLDLREAGWDP